MLHFQSVWLTALIQLISFQKVSETRGEVTILENYQSRTVLPPSFPLVSLYRGRSRTTSQCQCKHVVREGSGICPLVGAMCLLAEGG